MIALFKKRSWKIVGAILLVYVLIGGMLVPLGAGIKSVLPYQFTENKIQTFTVKGHNTHFLNQKKSLKIWIKTGLSHYYTPIAVAVKDNDHLSFDFAVSRVQLDTAKSSHYFDVVINNDEDGTITLRDALALLPSATAGDDTILLANEQKPNVTTDKAANIHFPYREILYESIRNTFYHVPMWFAMLFVLLFSVFYSVKYLSTGDKTYDIIASQSVFVGLFFGMLGIFTGMMWATYTWGEPWPNDPKLNGAAIGILIYLAYVVLRGSITNEIQRAKIAAVYNVFAIVIYILFIFIIPRLTDSLHPGNGGNPAFSKYDLDSTLRLFFYPAVIGWVILAMWIVSVAVRIELIKQKKSDNF